MTKLTSSRVWCRLVTCAPIGNRRQLRGPKARAQDSIRMPRSFLDTKQSALIVRRTPWSAADALVGFPDLDSADFVADERVQGDPRGPGGPPHEFTKTQNFGKTKWHWDAILPYKNS
jgi:hypothetical protein